GFAPGGADAWAWQDLLVPGVSIGAPPDEFNTQGQVWGMPPFDPWKLQAAGYRPFVETIRASLRHAGALRIDHALGLARLYWVPDGAPTTSRPSPAFGAIATSMHNGWRDCGPTATAGRRSGSTWVASRASRPTPTSKRSSSAPTELWPARRRCWYRARSTTPSPWSNARTCQGPRPSGPTGAWPCQSPSKSSSNI